MNDLYKNGIIAKCTLCDNIATSWSIFNYTYNISIYLYCCEKHNKEINELILKLHNEVRIGITTINLTKDTKLFDELSISAQILVEKLTNASRFITDLSSSQISVFEPLCNGCDDGCGY